jgi:hypothetical protein
MSRFGRLIHPFARRATQPLLEQLDQRFETTAARIESHTLNLAEHHAQLRDESIRAIVNEVRANSAFLADSVVAMDRLNERRLDLTHAAVRPLVHVVRATMPIPSTVILVDQIDPVLVDELVTAGDRVFVVEPAVDYTLPPEVVIANVAIARFRGPDEPVPLVVWNVRERPSAEAMAAVRSWLRADGTCIMAAPLVELPSAQFREAECFGFRKTESGRFSRAGADAAAAIDLTVRRLVAI